MDNKDNLEINVAVVKDDLVPNQDLLPTEEEPTPIENPNRYIYETYDDEDEYEEEEDSFLSKINIKQLRNILLIILLILLLLLGLLFGYLYFRNRNSNVQQEKQLKDTIVFKLDDQGKEISSFEYGKDIIDPLTLLETYEGVAVSTEKIDTSKLGDIIVKYTFTRTNSKGEVETYDVTKKYEVKDTNKPIIKFKENAITLELNSEFNPDTNIENVSDVVDGIINKSDKLENNTYIVTSNVDPKTAGDYIVKVEAQDSNGNSTTSEYKVTVKPAEQQEEEEEPEPEPQQQEQQQTSHVHNWVERSNQVKVSDGHYENQTVHHDAEYKTETIVDEEGWEETVSVQVWIDPVLDEEGNVVTEGGYEDREETIYHPAKTHEETTLVTEAYDETVRVWVNEPQYETRTYYVCTICGETRE